MNYAYENKITIGNIRKLWEIVTKDVCENEGLAGTQFRAGMVYVGKTSVRIFPGSMRDAFMRAHVVKKHSAALSRKRSLEPEADACS